MSLSDEHLDVAIREVLDESRTTPDDHPEPDVLLAYHQDELPEPEADSVRDHLAECLECSQVILDFAAFPDLEPATEAHRATPAGMRREWTGLQERIAGERSPWWRSHEYVGLPAAALFLVMVLGLGAWVWQLRERNAELDATVTELEAPNGDMSLAIVEPSSEGSRGSGGSGGVKVFRSGRDRVFLFLTMVESPYRPERYDGFERFTLDVRSSSDRLLLEALPLRPQPGGGFLVDLPVSAFEAGTNTLEVYGDGPGGRELIHEYRVAFDPDEEAGWADGLDVGPDRADP